MLAAGVVRSLASHWWVFLIRGLLALIFGGLVLAFPGTAILAFTIIFAAYAFVDGVMSLVGAFRSGDNRGWQLFRGIVGVGIGLVAFLEPELGLSSIAWALAITIGVWALVSGVLEIMLAIKLRKEINNEWLLITLGALSAILGVFLLFEPVIALVTWVWVVAIYAFIAGVGFIAFSFRLKKVNDSPVGA
jgi:uncharacterized membrane protein HdeD (DUF308 family)